MTGASMDKVGHRPVAGHQFRACRRPPSDPEQISDEATIRNAVSSANLGVLGPRPLAWANQDTGSVGTVSEIAEAKENGQLCRRFKTSRESFEGIALFAGKACLDDGGEWAMSSFRRALTASC